MAYKDMKTSYYLFATLFLYALIMGGAIAISNISTVFDFASAISVTALAFIFPGWFYLKADSKFGHGESTWRCISYMFLTIGFMNFCLGITASILNIASE